MMNKISVSVCIFVIAVSFVSVRSAKSQIGATDAPAGFDGLTNGFVSKSQFKQDRDKFEERETIDEGLGPVYNAQSCVECHQSAVTGGLSQITELRAGHYDGTNFVDAPGGSLINDRAIDAAIQEHVPYGYEVQTFRTSQNVLGDGFVESIDDATLQSIAASQPALSGGKIAGQVIMVPVLEAAPGTLRAGRFGWKNQHASLISFSADAYLNEVGITSPLQPTENTSMGNSVTAFDTVPDPEDPAKPSAPFGVDVEAFARFIRATKVPPRDATLAATSDAGSI